MSQHYSPTIGLVSYDPTIYLGTAAHYIRGRPPYSRALAPTLAAAVGLDGSGRLLDVGCGPGVLTLDLAGHVAEAVGPPPGPPTLGPAPPPAAAARAPTRPRVPGPAGAHRRP